MRSSGVMFAASARCLANPPELMVDEAAFETPRSGALEAPAPPMARDAAGTDPEAPDATISC